MRRTRSLLVVTGIAFLCGMTSSPAADVARVQPNPQTRLLSVRIFWLDPGNNPGPPGSAFPEPTPGASYAPRRNELFLSQVLSEEEPGGWHRGRGRALVVLPNVGARRSHYALARVADDPYHGPQLQVDRVIGTRLRTRHGAIHSLELRRIAALPDFARTQVMEMIDLRLVKGKVYWEAAFELGGVHSDEVEWVDALGPGLIHPPRRWMRVLDGAFDDSSAAAADASSCIGFSMLQLCTSMPKMARSLSRDAWPRERNRVRLTRTLWHAGDAVGVVVTGRLLDYSLLTFRVRANGKGSLPAGVRYLQPYDMTMAEGWIRSGEGDPSFEKDGRLPLPRAKQSRTPRRHRRAGWGHDMPPGLGGPRLAQLLPIQLVPVPRPDRDPR